MKNWEALNNSLFIMAKRDTGQSVEGWAGRLP